MNHMTNTGPGPILSEKAIAGPQGQQRRMNLSRRGFLGGLGACIALPALESLVGGSRALGATFAPEAAGMGGTALATTASGAPLRTAFIYFPNGSIPDAWWPTAPAAAGATATTDYTLARTLAPLAENKALFQVLRGLDHKTAIGGKDGAGDHARANSTFLTGVRLKKSGTEIQVGQSIDQTLAKELRHLTRMSSLELSCDGRRQAGACDSGYSCAYQHNISWASATTPMAPESNPRLAFERLFGSGDHGQRWDNMKRRQATQRSILDFVMDDARAMNKRAGAKDREKLDEYLTGVRDIEARIQQAEKLGRSADPDTATPSGIPASYREHIDLMYDLLLLAFQTDSTRVATLMLAHDGSNRSFTEIGVAEGHHDLSHHQNNQESIGKIQKIDEFYTAGFAKFLTRLEATKDADGKSVLYNSQIVYGSGCADGNRHSHDNLPILLAGSAGGKLTPGRYVDHKSTPASNLFVGMSHNLGLNKLTRFGDSTAAIANL